MNTVPSCAIPMPPILLIDMEIGKHSSNIVSLGAYYDDEHSFEGQSIHELVQLWMKTSSKYISGHNFIQHDKTYLEQSTFNALMHRLRIIDTLYYFSMQLFPNFSTALKTLTYRFENVVSWKVYNENGYSWRLFRGVVLSEDEKVKKQ